VLRTLLSSGFLWVGIATLVLGTGPLVVTAILDPTSNPVGFGMLTFFTFWPSVAFIMVGLIHGIVRAIKERQKVME
jgi:hypothetical protein